MEENKSEIVEEKRKEKSKNSSLIEYAIIISAVLVALIITWVFKKDATGIYAIICGIICAMEVKLYIQTKSVIHLICFILWAIVCVLQLVSYGISASGILETPEDVTSQIMIIL